MSRTQYEYKVVYSQGYRIHENELNGLGQAGWRLIETVQDYTYFIREIQEGGNESHGVSTKRTRKPKKRR